MGNKKYWPQLGMSGQFVDLEFRARLALTLIEHFGVVAAKIEGEDTAGRAKLLLQSPQELVDRCFEIADRFVEKAEERGEVREATAAEDHMRRSGELNGIAQTAQEEAFTPEWKKRRLPSAEQVAAKKEAADAAL